MRRRHPFINVGLTSYSSPHERVSGFRNQRNVVYGIRKPRKFCLWNLKSCALESGVQLKESGIPLKIGIQNPSSTCSSDKDWNPVPAIRNPRRWVQNPRLDCLTWGDIPIPLFPPFVWLNLSLLTPSYSLCSFWSSFCLRSLISLSFSLLPFLVLSLFKCRFPLPLHTILLTQLFW